MKDSYLIPSVMYFGDLDDSGYEISYMLLRYSIKHEFIIYPDDDIIVIPDVSEIKGRKMIVEWISSFRYVIDLNSIRR